VFKEFLRYNLVGIANTIIGFGIIILLMSVGVDALKSNAIGYGIGAVLSYFLNSKYTFNDREHKSRKIVMFFLVLAVAYGLNYIVLQRLLPLTNPYLAQVLSAIVYTASAFLLMKFFVFSTKTTEDF